MKKSKLITLFFLAFFFGVSVVSSIEPYSSPILSILGASFLYIAIFFLKDESYKRNIFWGLAFSLSAGIFAFSWLATTLVHYAHLPWYLALPLFIIAILIFQIKIPLLFIAIKWSFSKTSLPLIWQLIFWAILGDLFSYQLFPWHWGNLLSGNLIIEQSAALWSVYGLGIFYFLQAFLFLHLFFYSYKFIKNKIHNKSNFIKANLLLFSLAKEKYSIIFSIIILLVGYSYGFFRLNIQKEYKKFKKQTIKVALVQSNTALQYNAKKNDKKFASESLNSFFNMGLQAIQKSRGNINLLIFPESAVPFHGITQDKINKDRGIYSTTFHSVIAFLSRYSKTAVLFNDLQGIPKGIYNNMEIFPLDGEKINKYHKQKLLPFGEYLPMEKVFPLLRTAFPEASRYVPGNKSNLLEFTYTKQKQKKLAPLSQKDLEILKDPVLVLKDWPLYTNTKKAKLLPLICYEALSPELVRSFFINQKINTHEKNKTKLSSQKANSAKVDFIVNLSNDAWFGNSLASYQHSSAARLRAIESNRYLIRATLSGISSIIDNKGHYVKRLLPPARAGILVADIPLLPNASTLYLKWGNALLYTFLLLILLAGMKGKTNAKKNI